MAQLRNQGDLRENTGFKFHIRCVGTLFWLLDFMNISAFTKKLLQIWVREYLKSPKKIVTISIFSVAIGFTVGYLNDMKDRELQEARRLESLDYSLQLKQLQQTEESLQQLVTFVSHQKTTLKQSQDTLSSLKLEQEKLRPLVESDRITVEAILNAQDQRNSTNIWRERSIGFALGIISSLVASFILAIFSYLKSKSKQV